MFEKFNQMTSSPLKGVRNHLKVRTNRGTNPFIDEDNEVLRVYKYLFDTKQYLHYAITNNRFVYKRISNSIIGSNLNSRWIRLKSLSNNNETIEQLKTRLLSDGFHEIIMSDGKPIKLESTFSSRLEKKLIELQNERIAKIKEEIKLQENLQKFFKKTLVKRNK